jgi:hypothetical protein
MDGVGKGFMAMEDERRKPIFEIGTSVSEYGSD